MQKGNIQLIEITITNLIFQTLFYVRCIVLNFTVLIFSISLMVFHISTLLLIIYNLDKPLTDFYIEGYIECFLCLFIKM